MTARAPFEVALHASQPSRYATMTEPRRTSLQRDFRIFREPGFLLALLLVGILGAGGAGLLIYAANKHGVPLSEYWR